MPKRYPVFHIEYKLRWFPSYMDFVEVCRKCTCKLSEISLFNNKVKNMYFSYYISRLMLIIELLI